MKLKVPSRTNSGKPGLRSFATFCTPKSSSTSVSFSEISDEKMQQILAKKVHRNEAQFEQKLKNMKCVVLKEAAEFIKTQAKQITTILSKQHHAIVK